VDLLADLTTVLVPDAVWREVQRHRPSALRRRSLPLQRTTLLPDPPLELSQLAEMFSLGSGEVEALRLMQGLPNAVFLTDDMAARLVAQRLGYRVHGTIGVVVRALRQQQRTKRQVLNLLRAIPRRSTLFIDRQLLNSIIDEIDAT
jgi:predicted nucleic acid-binding protein